MYENHYFLPQNAPTGEAKMYSHINTVAKEDFLVPKLLQEINNDLVRGRQTAWGIGRRSGGGPYFIMHLSRCVPLIYMRLDLSALHGSVHLAATEKDINFLTALQYNPETRRAHVILYHDVPHFKELLSSDTGPIRGYLFAVGKISEKKYYGLFATFCDESSSVLDDGAPELLYNWFTVTQLFEVRHLYVE